MDDPRFQSEPDALDRWFTRTPRLERAVHVLKEADGLLQRARKALIAELQAAPPAPLPAIWEDLPTEALVDTITAQSTALLDTMEAQLHRVDRMITQERGGEP